MNKLVIRQAVYEDCHMVAALIETVFATYNAPVISLHGQAQFLTFISPASIRARLFSGAYMLLAFVDDELVGVIEMRIYSHVALLFTAQAYQQCGVARALLQSAITKCREQRPALQQITVNSSIYGVPIYKKLGFECRSGAEKDGMKFTPMVLAL